MIVGVAHYDLGEIMAKSLHLMGVEKGWVVHGMEGLDEISPQGSTHIWAFDPFGSIQESEISPKDFGLPCHDLSLVSGGGVDENSKIMRQLLSNSLGGPILDFVLMNSAALLLIADKVNSLVEGVKVARHSISSGAALMELERFIKIKS